jgi:hypothetical protein
MSLVRTARLNVTSADAFGAGVYTPAAFTPTNGALVVVILQAQSSSDGGMEGADLTLTNSLSLEQTLRVTSPNAPAGWSYGSRIWTFVGTGASMTLSADAGAHSVENYRFDVYEFSSDASGTVGVGATATGTDADGNGAAAITLSAAPATSSHVLAAANVALSSEPSGSMTEGAGWTQLTDVGRGDWWVFGVQTRTGSTSTSVDWADLNAGGGTALGAVLMALEITETVGGGGVVDDSEWPAHLRGEVDSPFTVGMWG